MRRLVRDQIPFYVCSKGKREPWTVDLGEMVRVGASCRAMCTACEDWRDVDLEALPGVIVPEACLWGKRVKCRLLPGCAKRFFYLQGGRYVGMWSA